MYSVLTDEAKFISRKVYPGGIRREWVWDLQRDDNGVSLPKVTGMVPMKEPSMIKSNVNIER